MTTRPLFAAAAAFVSSPAFVMASNYKCAVGDTAQAKNDVEVYSGPVEPRFKYKSYFIKKGTQRKVLARHEEGWCELAGGAPRGREGWVAEDHLMAAGSGAQDEGAPAPTMLTFVCTGQVAKPPEGPETTTKQFAAPSKEVAVSLYVAEAARQGKLVAGAAPVDCKELN